MPRIAIVYLAFYFQPEYINRMVAALQQNTYPRERIELIIVCNPHPTDPPIASYIEARVLPESGRTLPRITLIKNERNFGFAKGNNIGIAHALARGFDFIFLLNNDAYPASGAFEPLVSVMEADPSVVIAQPLLLLHQARELVNSSGNMIHFLGFGFCRDYRRRASELTLGAVVDIPYASGAALLVRASFIRNHGALDEDLLTYHEDLEWSLRARSRGYRVVLVRNAVAYHEYEFLRSIKKYFLMERNRFAVLLMYFKVPTLLTLTPAFILMEAGTFIFALIGGWWREKLRVYTYWFRPAHWRLWLRKRSRIQAARAVSDKALTRECTGRIEFQEAAAMHPLVRFVGNPFFSTYWGVVRRCMWW